MTDCWGTEESPWNASPYEGDQGLSSDSLAAQISLATNAFISPEILDTISEYDGMDSPHLNGSENSGPRSYSAVSNREPPPPTGECSVSLPSLIVIDCSSKRRKFEGYGRNGKPKCSVLPHDEAGGSFL